MTALTFGKLFEGAYLSNVSAIVYTCPTTPASSCVKNMRVRFLNTSASSVTVLAYVATSAGVNTPFLYNIPIPSLGYIDTNVPTLGAGDSLTAQASVASVVSISEIGGVVFTS
jgi:hypothetical protein